MQPAGPCAVNVLDDLVGHAPLELLVLGRAVLLVLALERGLLLGLIDASFIIAVGL